MELGAEEEGVNARGEFRNFHKAAVGRFTGEDETCFFELLDVVGIDLETVAVALRNRGFPVAFGRDGPLLKLARVGAQAHRATVVFLGEFLHLLRQYHDDGMLGLRVYLGRMRALEPRDVAREFDGGKLHAVTEAEVRNFIFADEADCMYLALDARLAEAAGDAN